MNSSINALIALLFAILALSTSIERADGQEIPKSKLRSLFGQEQDARRMVGPLLDFNRRATRFHVAGHKLQLLAHYYWVTRDAVYLNEKRSVWEPVIELIRSSRKTDNGLLPKDNYAGDISQQVYSLNSNANCWRGLRDMATVLDEIGDHSQAAQLRQEAADSGRRSWRRSGTANAAIPCPPSFRSLCTAMNRPMIR